MYQQKKPGWFFLTGVLTGLAVWLILFVKIVGQKPHLRLIKTMSEVANTQKENFDRGEKEASLSGGQATPPAPKITKTPQVPKGFCLKVPVLVYHHVEPADKAKELGQVNISVTPEYFEEQMKYLVSHGYRAISAEELVNSLAQHREIPGKIVVVSVDDGYDDVYTYAFPIAQKYGIILNLMIPTGLMENSGYLSWKNLKEMVDSGIVFAYAHTWSHSPLPRNDDDKLQMEITMAKTQLEEQLGRPVKIFAYPYGSTNQRVIEALKKYGFIGTFSMNSGFYQCDSFLYNLRRNRVGNISLSAYGL